MPNLIGLSLGRYHILEQLGEGGMATVYKAYDTRLERDVAIKIIRTGAFPPEQLERFLKRFDREAKALARLTHPNIVSVIDYGEFEGAPFLVMTYLPGGTLKPQMGKSMPWQEAVKLVLPIAEALDYAHSQNIIHRDIKPSNILLTQRSQPMLSDFGIAKILGGEETAALTSTGVGVGTPEYMAPEQWIGQAGPQSDLYSLGVVLYELVTGRKPYTADTPAAIMLKQINDPLPRPRQFAPDLPEDLEKVLFKALAKKPEDRYQNMSEFAAALEQLMLGQTSLAGGKGKETRKLGEEQTLLAAGRGEKAAEAAQKVPILPEVAGMPGKWGRWGAWLGIGGAALAVMAVVILLGLRVSGNLGPGKPYVSTHIPTFTLSPTAVAWKRPADGMLMVYVPKGNFSMGSNNGLSDEKPVHTVSLDAYWIDKTEVTNAMYAKCVQAGACQAPPSSASYSHSSYYGNSQYADYPVIYVDWNKAQTYCGWAGVHLPTEAEWEKAARGTDGRTYPWGSKNPSKYLLNYNSIVGDTTAVGSFPSGASPYGALDMAGNVWEWVADWYDVNYYSNSPSSNPKGPSIGTYRVLRGGTWRYNEVDARTSARFWEIPSSSSNLVGFRCSRSATP